MIPPLIPWIPGAVRSIRHLELSCDKLSTLELTRSVPGFVARWSLARGTSNYSPTADRVALQLRRATSTSVVTAQIGMQRFMLWLRLPRRTYLFMAYLITP